MRLAEQPFFSVQGEGSTTGRLALFIRTAGCNLRCTKAVVGFDCDTNYSWDEGIEYSIIDLEKYIRNNPMINRIIFTGGEPMLHCAEIENLIIALGHDTYQFELETNGTLVEELEYLSWMFDIIHISPKKGFENKHLLSFLALQKNTEFKFVIKDEDALNYWRNLIDELHIDKRKIWLMPEGVTRDIIIERSPWLVEKCKQYGYNFSTRLHVLIWGQKRGV